MRKTDRPVFADFSTLSLRSKAVGTVLKNFAVFLLFFPVKPLPYRWLRQAQPSAERLRISFFRRFV
jgi:hypothetical protein